MTQTAIPQLERVGVVFNPTQENAERDAHKAADELRDRLPLASPHIFVMPTISGGVEANAERLSRIARPGDAYAIRMGDGGFGRFVEAAQSEPMEHLLGDISITSLNSGGNACDIGRSLHGRWNTTPSGIFSRRLQAVTAYTLQCSVKSDENGTQMYNAGLYVGFGKSGKGTEIVNHPDYRRGKKIIRDLGVMTSILSSDIAFDAITDKGDTFALGDLTYSNAPCMAKLGNYPVEMWDPEFRVTPVGKGRQAGAFAAATLLIGKTPGFNTDTPSRFTVGGESPVQMHYDGEPPILVWPGSVVEVGLAPGTYTALTTRLPYGQHAK